jgi:hypothetical protein
MKRGLALLAATVVLLGAVATPVASAIAYDASAAPQGAIETDVTIASHDRADMTALQYEDDGGDVQTLPAKLNESTDVDDLGDGTVNTFSYTPTDVEFSDASAFPINKDDVSAVDNDRRELRQGVGL